jgi:indole-3-glycerol phosphate synthase
MQGNMLDKFIRAKEEDISFLEKLEVKGRLPKPFQGQRPELIKSLNRSGPSIIAEYKRASPSKGVINSRISAHEAAQRFFKGEARAFSVLTEKKYFQGDINFLDVFAQKDLPVLRKDFLFHPLQIKETAATRASALLLIVRVVSLLSRLRKLVEMSLDFGLEPVVEIFNYQELDLARRSGARVILVNNRDLDRLLVDLNVSRKLIKEKDSRETWICASGIEKKSQVDQFYSLGFEAFLIGTSIMSSDNPEIKLKELIS